MSYRICVAGFSLLFLTVLSACHQTRIPLANRPASVEVASSEVAWSEVRTDTPGFGEGACALECEEEEDPCRELHKVNLFVGTSIIEEEHHATFGLDYEYKISEKVGLGGFVDITTGDLRETALGAGLFLHPTERTFFVIAPGVHLSKHEETKLLLRLGTGYEFEVGRGWTVGPAAFVDLVDGLEPVFVLGVNIGKGWR